MNSHAPVALFAYNRADHLEQTVAHLQKNEGAEDTDIYLFSDAAKNAAAEQGVQEVRKFGGGITGFRSVTVIAREQNWGLLKSMIHGVGEIAAKHGRVVVVEDDIVTAPPFLRYMNDALDFYEDYPCVGSISGYLAPSVCRRRGLTPGTFFHYRTNCWGWATWWSRWGKVNWDPSDWRTYLYDPRTRPLLARGGSDLLYMMESSFSGRNQSWMARWYYHCMMHGMLTLYPARSLTDNIGFDGSGTHITNTNMSVFDRYRTDITRLEGYKAEFVLPVAADELSHRLMKRFWDAPWWVGSPTGQALKKCYKAVRSVAGGRR